MCAMQAVSSLANMALDPQIQAMRVPPQSIEAEQSVLGGLLLETRRGTRFPTSSAKQIFIALITG